MKTEQGKRPLTRSPARLRLRTTDATSHQPVRTLFRVFDRMRDCAVPVVSYGSATKSHKYGTYQLRCDTYCLLPGM